MIYDIRDFKDKLNNKKESGWKVFESRNHKRRLNENSIYVRISNIKNKKSMSTNLRIYIGNNICALYGWGKLTLVDVLLNEDFPHILKIRKNEDGYGRKLCHSTLASAHHFDLLYSNDLNLPSDVSEMIEFDIENNETIVLHLT